MKTAKPRYIVIANGRTYEFESKDAARYFAYQNKSTFAKVNIAK